MLGSQRDCAQDWQMRVVGQAEEVITDFQDRTFVCGMNRRVTVVFVTENAKRFQDRHVLLDVCVTAPCFTNFCMQKTGIAI